MSLLLVAVAAVVLTGLREVPALLDCYTFLRGVNRSRRDVEVIGSAYGLDSNAGRRALLNARQTQEQAEEYWREHLPGPAGLLCAAVAGLSCLGLIVAGPVIGLRVVILRIAGRRRADPRAVTQVERIGKSEARAIAISAVPGLLNETIQRTHCAEPLIQME